jgi:hypothetical protein
MENRSPSLLGTEDKIARIPTSLIVFLLGTLTIFLRVQFRSKTLFNWDSVNFALGIMDFDVIQHRPHPP